MTTRVSLILSPRVSVQVFAQPLIASGDFKDYKEFNRPRSFDFDIYGKEKGTITRDDATGRYTVDPDGIGGAPAFSFADRDFNQRSLRGNAVLRWEYRPGSSLFVVWSQGRLQDDRHLGNFAPGRDYRDLFSARPDNTLLVKASYWLSF